MPRALAPAVRAQIVEHLAAGKGCNETARLVTCSPSTVTAVARAEGYEFGHSQVKIANAARRDYGLAERRALINSGFEKAEELLADLATAPALASWTVAVGTLIDKRRLEDGDVTARTETHDTGAAINRITGRLDELSARRGTQRASG